MSCKRGGYFFDNWSELEQEIADEWTIAHARKTPLGWLCRCCCRCWCQRKNVVAFYVMSIGFGLCSLLLLIGFCIFIVRPYVRALSFVETTCTTVEAIYDENRKIVCTCGGRRASCISYYPCLNITVRFERSPGIYVTSLLHSSEFQSSCTANPSCSRQESANRRKVKSYQFKYGYKGSSFSCFYNPAWGSTEVIQSRSEAGFIDDFVIWPSAITSVCLVIILLTLCTCGYRYHLRHTPPSEISRMAGILEGHNIFFLSNLSPKSRRRILEQFSHSPPLPQETLSPVFNPPPIVEVLEDEELDGPFKVSTV